MLDILGERVGASNVINPVDFSGQSFLKNKNRRMYHEVRFHRNTSQALKKEAAVFRLKKDSRNLQTTEYANNLCQYLDQSRSMYDLRNVLTGLNGVIGENRSSEEVIASPEGSQCLDSDMY